MLYTYLYIIIHNGYNIKYSVQYIASRTRAVFRSELGLGKRESVRKIKI